MKDVLTGRPSPTERWKQKRHLSVREKNTNNPLSLWERVRERVPAGTEIRASPRLFARTHVRRSDKAPSASMLNAVK